MVDGRIHPAEAHLDRGVAGRGVHDRIGHVDRAHHAGAIREEDPGGLDLVLRIPEGRSHDDADPVPVGGIDPEPRVVRGHPDGGRRHGRKAVHLPQVFHRDEIAGLKRAHLCPQMGGKPPGRKGCDLPDSRLALHEGPRKGLFSRPQRGDHADPGNDDPSIHAAPPHPGSGRR